MLYGIDLLIRVKDCIYACKYISSSSCIPHENILSTLFPIYMYAQRHTYTLHAASTIIYTSKIMQSRLDFYIYTGHCCNDATIMYKIIQTLAIAAAVYTLIRLELCTVQACFSSIIIIN